eukprot:s1845_g10.t1
MPDPNDKSRPWKHWAPSEWKVPKQLRFSALLIPTIDSCRADYIIDVIAKQELTKTPPNYKSSLMVGAAGTAKTSTAKMFLNKYPVDVMLSKRINFSSATTPLGLQRAIEGEVERKTGKTFCPPGGKNLTVFLDDASMPLVNKWGDQVTNELTRQLIEFGGFYFLDRDKRGEFKKIEQLKYIAAMGHPGGGRRLISCNVKTCILHAERNVKNHQISSIRSHFQLHLRVIAIEVSMDAEKGECPTERRGLLRSSADQTSVSWPVAQPDPKYDPLHCFPCACPFLPLATGIFYVLTIFGLVFFGTLSFVAGILCCIPWGCFYSWTYLWCCCPYYWNTDLYQKLGR